MFAGSCIGVILLVMSLEFLRRASREYDRYILSQAKLKQQLHTSPVPRSLSDNGSAKVATTANITSVDAPARKFRPDFLQQAIRALLHMAQFAVAYFIMLLAMYYNGYIIISIIIGAFLGSFAFSWEPINLG
jgi:copper transporter 1